MRYSTLLIQIEALLMNTLVLTLAISAWVFLASPKIQAAEAAAVKVKPALTVTVARPQTASLSLQLSANGNIAAWQEAIVGTQANGLPLLEVLVNVGDVVRKGQLLARFDEATVQADVAQTQAALSEAQVNASAAQADADRARSLQNTEALSAQQMAQYLSTERAAAARVQSAQAVLKAQQLRLAYTQVLAPDSGVISARTATVGAVVGTGTELFRLIRQGRLEWRAEVTSAELVRMRPGTGVTLVAASGEQVKGRVRMLAPTVDAQNRSALVYVDIPPMRRGSLVLPGMFAKGNFELGASNGLTVPQQALVIRDGFSYVFRYDEKTQKVTQIKVKSGRRNGTQIEILEGLKADDSLAVAGAGFLNDGDAVKVAP